MTPRPTLLAALLLCASASFANASDWLYAPSDYTHSPATGQRVAQYAEIPPVEPLDDPRQTVSRYWTTRTRLRGADGSNDVIYDVKSFGNTLGGFDAQSERAFDASIRQLRALEPFRRNPFLFYGGSPVGAGGYGQGAYGYGPWAPQQQPQPHTCEHCGAAAQGPGPGPTPQGAPVGFPPFGVPTQPFGGAAPFGVFPYFSPFWGHPYGGYGGGYGGWHGGGHGGGYGGGHGGHGKS